MGYDDLHSVAKAVLNNTTIPNLSVVVLSYNQDKTIKHTLDSLLEQAHPYSMEIIVADDASDDQTPVIIAEYAIKFPNIVKPILRNKNLGIICNYFEAISHCTGKYIACCAGDDYWLQDKIVNQVSFMDSHPDIGLSFTFADVINENGDFLGHYTNYTDIDSTVLLRVNPVPAPTIMYRRDLVLKYIDEINPISKPWKCEDWPLLLWFSINSKIGCIKTPLAIYQFHSHSITHSPDVIKKIEFGLSDINVQLFFLKRYYINNQDEITNREIRSFFLQIYLSILKKEDIQSGLIQLATFNLTLKNRIKLFCLKHFPKYLLRLGLIQIYRKHKKTTTLYAAYN